MAQARKKFVFKIGVGGDGGTGKTTLLHRYISNRFVADTAMTIGIQIGLKTVNFGGVEATLCFWDFGGQERFRFLLPTYCSGAKGALLIFDLTNMHSTFGLENSWLPILRKEDLNLPVVLIGTKTDMVDPNFPCIEPGFGNDFVTSHHLHSYIETSSKTGDKVEDALRLLVKSIFDYNKIPYDPNLA
jgi:small GTP-binding protein